LKTRRTRGSTSVLSYQVRSVAATGWASLANVLLMFDQTSWSHGGRAADGLYLRACKEPSCRRLDAAFNASLSVFWIFVSPLA
jgi:hypothetical protein